LNCIVSPKAGLFRIAKRLYNLKTMAHDPEIMKLIDENRSLFWWIKPEKRKDISINALVEAILNYGDEKSVKRLFDLMGTKTVADIFHRQVSGTRTNYHRRTKHFFQMYFKRHAQ